MVNDVHSSNALFSIEVTDEGISISINDEHFLKVASLIIDKEDGISIEESKEQPSNACSPINVTKEGSNN